MMTEQEVKNMNEVADRIANKVVSIASYPKFGIGDAPVNVAAKVFG
ncbi:hypothetical protein ACTQ6A_01665 [Lachnospiraceae bacterium LCP25S3_G4]